MTSPSALQVDFVRSLQKKLRLPDRMLDDHSTTRFGSPFSELDRSQVSVLIDEMIAWKAIPADLQRAQGQLDLIPEAQR